MQIDVGYFYFVKDDFFEIIDDPELMKNKENGIKRPCYFCFKSKENDKIIWFVPVSTKVDKYKKIYENKIQKQIKLGKTPSIDTIIFGYVANTLSNKLQNEIISKANKVLNLYNHGMKNIIFPDIDNILKQLLK
jgi:hypothetical protein